eukprot:m.96411 g.96411  ORF g.96411 m.96411 type:complete len:310 (-) comp10163_c0_seq2:761-1690(-)
MIVGVILFNKTGAGWLHSPYTVYHIYIYVPDGEGRKSARYRSCRSTSPATTGHTSTRTIKTRACGLRRHTALAVLGPQSDAPMTAKTSATQDKAEREQGRHCVDATHNALVTRCRHKENGMTSGRRYHQLGAANICATSSSARGPSVAATSAMFSCTSACENSPSILLTCSKMPSCVHSVRVKSSLARHSVPMVSSALAKRCAIASKYQTSTTPASSRSKCSSTSVATSYTLSSRRIFAELIRKSYDTLYSAAAIELRAAASPSTSASAALASSGDARRCQRARDCCIQLNALSGWDNERETLAMVCMA